MFSTLKLLNAALCEARLEGSRDLGTFFTNINNPTLL